MKLTKIVYPLFKMKGGRGGGTMIKKPAGLVKWGISNWRRIFFVEEMKMKKGNIFCGEEEKPRRKIFRE